MSMENDKIGDIRNPNLLNRLSKNMAFCCDFFLLRCIIAFHRYVRFGVETSNVCLP